MTPKEIKAGQELVKRMLAHIMAEEAKLQQIPTKPLIEPKIVDLEAEQLAKTIQDLKKLYNR
jgi:hypothetical protein